MKILVIDSLLTDHEYLEDYIEDMKSVIKSNLKGYRKTDTLVFYNHEIPYKCFEGPAVRHTLDHEAIDRAELTLRDDLYHLRRKEFRNFLKENEIDLVFTYHAMTWFIVKPLCSVRVVGRKERDHKTNQENQNEYLQHIVNGHERGHGELVES